MKVREAREFIEESIVSLTAIASTCESTGEVERATYIRTNSIPALTTAVHALKKLEAEMGNVSFVGVDKVGV
jgi:hypothetical protein